MCRYVFLQAACLVYLIGPAMADQSVQLGPQIDAFVREVDPASNFGGAGLLCVAGEDSVNGSEQPRGRFDSLMRFDASAALDTFDVTFGAGAWEIAGINLQVYQLAAPENLLFPRGEGDFSILWISEDDWAEGTGTPNAPVQSENNELTWETLETLLLTADEASLGTFTSEGTSGTHQYELALQADIVSDLLASGVITLHIAPATETLGFTFHSRSFSDPDRRPILTLTAAAFLLGDMNCDGALDEQDIIPFAFSLVSPDTYPDIYECGLIRADMNQDSFTDGRDVQAFVAALLTP